MRSLHFSQILVTGLFLIAATARAQMTGIGGGLDWSTSNTNSPAPSTAPNNQPNATATTTATNQNARAEAKLRELNAQIAQRIGYTTQTIEPLTTEEIGARLEIYRERVNAVREQPFLAGLRPPPELIQGTREWRARWRGLGPSIREGNMPREVKSSILQHLKVTGAPAQGTNIVPMTGAIWAAISDEYFSNTATLQALLEKANRHLLQESEKLEKLITLIDEATSRFEHISHARPNPGLPQYRREMTFKLHEIWMLGVQLQTNRIHRLIDAGDEVHVVDNFIEQVEPLRHLHHRRLTSVVPDAPLGSDAPAPVVVPAPAGIKIEARLDGAGVTTNVRGASTNRLADLAEELYHAHYLVKNAEAFVREDEAKELATMVNPRAGEIEARRAAMLKERAGLVAERLRPYEGRRQAVVQELTAEANRVLAAAASR